MKTSKTQRRALPELNASSMADIAFLLLVFFLVSTIIETEDGITVKLPPMNDYEPPHVNARNVLNVSINFADQLLLEGDPVPVQALRQRTKSFIMNPQGDPGLAERPAAAIVSLRNDRSTHYRTYLTVYNELKAAYNELWDEEAQRRYGAPFDRISRSRQRAVRNYIPLVISEGDLVDLATK